MAWRCFFIIMDNENHVQITIEEGKKTCMVLVNNMVSSDELFEHTAVH
jgi:hypothetical protein